MAGQSIFFRTLSFLNNGGGKVILSNRANRVNLTPTSKTLKKDAKDFEKYKVPEKPKKPLTSFFTYLVEKRSIVEKENPTLTSKDIIKKLSEVWKSLSPEVRKKYEEQAQQNKNEYQEKIEDYIANLTPEQESIIKQRENEKHEDRERRRHKKELRNERKPKRPGSSFGLFVCEQSKGKKYKETSTLSEFMNEIKSQWAKLTEVEKDKYRFEYKKKKEQYEKELVAWEHKMIAEGKEHLVREKILKEYGSKGKGVKKIHKSQQEYECLHFKTSSTSIGEDTTVKRTEANGQKCQNNDLLKVNCEKISVSISENVKKHKANERGTLFLKADETKPKSSVTNEANNKVRNIDSCNFETQEKNTNINSVDISKDYSVSSSMNRMQEVEKSVDKVHESTTLRGVYKKFRKFFKF